jgi:hypothetical protein
MARMSSPSRPPSSLPPRPLPPDPSECCGNGCDPCVHDLYAEQLLAWESRVAALTRDAGGTPERSDAA